MNKRKQTAAKIATLLILIAAAAMIIHYHQVAVYTASLATRPLNAGLVGAVKSVDPATVSTAEEQMVASAMYEGLVAYDDKSGTIKPLLAKNWKYSSDGKNLTITLNKNIKFHNGKKMTAYDVKAAWERNITENKDWNAINLFEPISGVRPLLEGHVQDISGIKVANDNSLKIQFEQPDTAFIYSLYNPVFWVYDGSTPVNPAPGTGPFVLKNNEKNQTFTLFRFPDYHRGSPPLTALHIQVYESADQAYQDFKSGKLDYLNQVPLSQIKAVQKDPVLKKAFIHHPLFNTYSLDFNMNKEPYLNNYNLRRALNYAIDRQAIADKVLAGAYRPLQGPLPAGVKGFNAQMRGYAYNLDKAKDMLEKAGFPGGENLHPLVLAYDDDEGHSAVMESIADQLAKIGVQVQLVPMKWDYYTKQVSKMEMSCCRVSWQADYPDPDAFMYGRFHRSKIGISNLSAYYNPQVNKLLDQARTKPWDGSERIKAINQAERIIVDDAPCLWLFQKMSTAITGSDVKCLTVDKMGMIDWSVVELHKPSMEPSSKPEKNTDQGKATSAPSE